MSEQLMLPEASWEEGASVRAAGGRKLRRWGSVPEAGRMLWGVGKDKVYAMIQAGEIKGVKMGTSRNSRWRVDLMTVWEYKVRAENGDGIKL